VTPLGSAASLGPTDRRPPRQARRALLDGLDLTTKPVVTPTFWSGITPHRTAAATALEIDGGVIYGCLPACLGLACGGQTDEVCSALHRVERVA
jgi:hypothetical protein